MKKALLLGTLAVVLFSCGGRAKKGPAISLGTNLTFGNPILAADSPHTDGITQGHGLSSVTSFSNMSGAISVNTDTINHYDSKGKVIYRTVWHCDTIRVSDDSIGLGQFKMSN